MKISVTPTAAEAYLKAKAASFKSKDLVALKAKTDASTKATDLRKDVDDLWAIVYELVAMLGYATATGKVK